MGSNPKSFRVLGLETIIGVLGLVPDASNQLEILLQISEY